MAVVMVRKKLLRYTALVALIAVFSILAVFYRHQTTFVVAEPIYQGSEDKQQIALTCNVFWGEEYLDQMLKDLKQCQVNMTFFIGGSWAEKNQPALKKIQQHGHEIASHGYGHPHPDQISVEQNQADITRAEEVIEQITGVKPTLFAPPYGERGPNVLAAAEKCGYKTILWSIDTIDWQRPSPQVIFDRVLNKAHPGAIVLMHPTDPTAKALPDILDSLIDEGYQLVTVSELLKTT